MQKVVILFIGIIETPFTLGSLLKVEGMNKKTKNVILLLFSWVTKATKGVWVYALSFRRKIWTKVWWYFLLVALYYGKIYKRQQGPGRKS